MEKPSSYCLAMTTYPDKASAQAFATLLVERGLAACVNIVPGLTAVYQWEGELKTGEECLLMIKTQASRAPEIEALLTENHPYELAEWLVLPIQSGSQDYLAWIEKSTKAI